MGWMMASWLKYSGEKRDAVTLKVFNRCIQKPNYFRLAGHTLEERREQAKTGGTHLYLPEQE